MPLYHSRHVPASTHDLLSAPLHRRGKCLRFPREEEAAANWISIEARPAGGNRAPADRDHATPMRKLDLGRCPGFAFEIKAICNGTGVPDSAALWRTVHRSEELFRAGRQDQP